MVIMIGGNSATPPLRRPAPLGSGVAAVPFLTQAPARPPSESPPFGVGRGPAPDRVRVVERLEDALRPGPGGRIRDPAVRGSGEMGFYRMGLDKAPPPPRGGGWRAHGCHRVTRSAPPNQRHTGYNTVGMVGSGYNGVVGAMELLRSRMYSINSIAPDPRGWPPSPWFKKTRHSPHRVLKFDVKQLGGGGGLFRPATC